MPAAAASFPMEFVFFAATLLGVALCHRHTLSVALAGLAAILAYKFLVAGFDHGAGADGFGAHMAREWVELANLALLLLGFALLARHFELTRLPDLAPDVLPHNWSGGFALLAMVFVGSAFLDNIAAALIGATLAAHVYDKRVHIAFLAAIVAAANAGGAGSVVGDTTTTMMWIAGKSPLDVVHAYIAAAPAFLICAVPAALIQERHGPMLKHHVGAITPDWIRVGVVAFILIAAIAANTLANLIDPDLVGRVPVVGLALWGALIVAALVRKPDLKALSHALNDTLFLLTLVLAASFMPVAALPAASWQTTFGLGMVSSVFNNIPLTALALKQGGFDWGMLAYTVGFGGSMIWFGSSAGVAVANLFPEAKSTWAWLRGAWFVPVAYAAGFFVMLGLWGWRPD